MNCFQSVKRWTGIMALVFAVCRAPVAGAAEVTSGSAGTFSYERYKILTDRNIYLKEQVSQRVVPILRVEPVLPPEHYIVLVGIVRRGFEYIAFLEDQRTGLTIRARAGDTLAQGHIGNITLDGMEYIKNDKTSRMEIGNNLQNVLSGPGPENLQSAGAAAGKPAAEAILAAPSVGTAPANAESILEQMRQRRLNQLNKK